MSRVFFFFLVVSGNSSTHEQLCTFTASIPPPLPRLSWGESSLSENVTDLEAGVSLPLRLQITHCRQDGGAFFCKVSFLRGGSNGERQDEETKIKKKKTTERFDPSLNLNIYHLADEASELLGHVFRVGSLQHQQHLLIQRLIQRGRKARVAGLMIDSMKALQKKKKKPKKQWGRFSKEKSGRKP